MTTAPEVKPDNVNSLEVERYWLDGLKAIDEQYEEAEQSRQRWLRIGRGLLYGRRKCPHSVDFGKWLDSTGYKVVDRIERHCAMWLAVNADVVMPALSETRIGTPQSAKLHIREKIRAVYAQCVEVSEASVTDEAPSSKRTSTNGTETEPNAAALQTSPPKKRPDRQAAACFSWERGDEVYNIFVNKHARGAIGAACKKYGGREIWGLILAAIDNGFLTPNEINTKKLTARVLFPNSPRDWWPKFSLTDKKQREYIRDVIMPAAIANREAILKQPKAIDTIVAEHVKANQIAVQKQEAQKKVVELVKALPENQKQIIAYGKQMWPVVNPTYDYDQVRAAVWSFQDLNRWFSQTLSGHNSPGSVAQIIRLSTKWLQEYLNRALPGEGGSKVRKIYVLIGELSRALENNPNGECRFPPPPHIEGQW